MKITVLNVDQQSYEVISFISNLKGNQLIDLINNSSQMMMK